MMNAPSIHHAPQPVVLQTCERCGTAFRCSALAGDATCWCASLPALPAERLRPGARCLCPACLAAEAGSAKPQK